MLSFPTHFGFSCVYAYVPTYHTRRYDLCVEFAGCCISRQHDAGILKSLVAFLLARRHSPFCHHITACRLHSFVWDWPQFAEISWIRTTKICSITIKRVCSVCVYVGRKGRRVCAGKQFVVVSLDLKKFVFVFWCCTGNYIYLRFEWNL